MAAEYIQGRILVPLGRGVHGDDVGRIVRDVRDVVVLEILEPPARGYASHVVANVPFDEETAREGSLMRTSERKSDQNP